MARSMWGEGAEDSNGSNPSSPYGKPHCLQTNVHPLGQTVAFPKAKCNRIGQKALAPSPLGTQLAGVRVPTTG